MHTNKIALLGALVLSIIIMMTGFQMSSYNVYHIPNLMSTNEEVVPSRAISFNQLSKKERREVECLANNIYYEAAFESRVGWMAVASVTMNRLLSGNYADTICGVVHQNNGRTYQFSWVGMKNKLSKINEDVYNEILKLATATYLNYDMSKDVTKGATYYHADYVNPGWRLERVKKIGRHIFYRSKRDSESLGEM
jgi:spore germination cell wall hydrolase CwlJ-like protein